MKRLVSLILVLFILFVPAIAEANPTKRVNAFQYSDVYAKRLDEISERYYLDARHDLSTSMYFSHEYTDGMCAVITPSGDLFVSVPDMDIRKASTTLCEFTDQNKISLTAVNLFRAASFFAALEYSPMEDEQYKSMHEYLGTGAETVIQEALGKIEGCAFDLIDNSKKMNILLAKKGNTMPFMTGNYDYSIMYNTFVYDDATYHSLELVAEAR